MRIVCIVFRANVRPVGPRSLERSFPEKVIGGDHRRSSARGKHNTRKQKSDDQACQIVSRTAENPCCGGSLLRDAADRSVETSDTGCPNHHSPLRTFRTSLRHHPHLLRFRQQHTRPHAREDASGEQQQHVQTCHTHGHTSIQFPEAPRVCRPHREKARV